MRGMIAVTALFGLLSGPLPAEEAYVDEYQQYLALTQELVGMIDHPQTAIYFAVESLVELHDERDDLPGAIDELEALLQRHAEDRYIATVLRYKLQDLYRIVDQPERARQHLEAMIDDNRPGLNP